MIHPTPDVDRKRAMAGDFCRLHRKLAARLLGYGDGS
jgi:hypothetical protein